MRMVPLFLALVLALGLAFVVFGSRSAPTSRARPEVEPEARTADAAVLARVRAIAWDHREIDSPLADELIRYLNARERDLDLRAVRHEVAEIAWRHRDDCPDLSVIVRDAVRD
jgi:hypothetical protein